MSETIIRIPLGPLKIESKYRGSGPYFGYINILAVSGVGVGGLTGSGLQPKIKNKRKK